MLFKAVLQNVDLEESTGPRVRVIQIEATDETDALIKAVREARKLVVYRVEVVTSAEVAEYPPTLRDAPPR